jgi:prepilin-type processing-associated H-X9-DG protein
MDVLAVMVGVLVLAAVVYACIWTSGEKRRVWVCAHHLKALGQAFADYAHDHNNELPPAVFDDKITSTSWDREIAPYLAPKLPKQSSVEERSNQLHQVAFYFKCPSDREPRGGAQPRSYSMPIYDLNKAGWPPDAQSMGGLGLLLDAKTVKKAQATDAVEVKLPVLKTTMVAAPADTALLVERISILNALWAARFACTISTKEQFDAKTFSSKEFHGGKMNYLLLDGHVELLKPTQSEGFMGGIWTLRQGD